MEYVDFQIIINGNAPNYQVQVVGTEGVTSVQPTPLRLPQEIDTQVLRTITTGRETEEQPTTADGAPLRAGRAFPEKKGVLSALEIGKKLTDALFVEPVRESFRNVCRDLRSRADEDARNGRQATERGVRLRLQIGAKELVGLPWEFLVDTTKDPFDFFALSRTTPVLRMTQDHASPPSVSDVPLPVLGMVGPQLGGVQLDLGKEQTEITHALEVTGRAASFVLTWVKDSSANGLLSALSLPPKAPPFRIFHFAGHGTSAGADGESGIIVLTGEGKQRVLSGNDLAQYLDGSGIRLVVLNCCKSATTDVSGLFASVARTLAARGVPAVIGMQRTISDPAATRFAAELYQELAEGHPIEVAITGARLALRIEDQSRIEWATPVLYLNSTDGQLFGSARVPHPNTSKTPVPSQPNTNKLPPPPRPLTGVILEVEWLKKKIREGRYEMFGALAAGVTLLIASFAIFIFPRFSHPPIADAVTNMVGVIALLFAAWCFIQRHGTKNDFNTNEYLLFMAGNPPSEQWFELFHKVQSRRLEVF